MSVRLSKRMWQWLNEQGYTKGDQALLNQGKKAWSRKYHREYKQQRRKEQVQRAIYLTLEENKEIRDAADKAQQTIAEYIKQLH
jgi:hypothetical protein